MKNDWKEGLNPRSDLTSQQFNWEEGRFTGDKENLLWLQLLFHFILGIGIILIPSIIYIRGLVPVPYSLFAPEPPKVYNAYLEIIRWTLLLGLGYLGVVLTNICVIIIIYLVYHFYALRKQETPRAIIRIMDHMLFLRTYVAWVVAAVVLLFASYTLFPLTKEESAIQLFGTGFGKETDKGAGVNDTADLMTGLAFAEYLKQYRAGHSLQFFVNRLASSMLILCGFILLEKIIIRKIATTFHYRSFEERIKNNYFAIKTSKELRNLILQRHPELAGADLATTIFSGICPPHRTSIATADIVAYIPAADAEKYFQMIDVEAIGEINQSQLRRSINRFLDEQEDLRIAMLDQASIIRKLDQLFFSFVMIFVAIFWTALFQVSFHTVLAALAGIGSILLLVSGGSIKTAFESIVFVVFTHPFDVGDKVIIKNSEYVVKELGLWTTTFEGSNKQLTYIANSKLRNEMIVNTRRSPFQSEIIAITVLPSTPTEKIRTLEVKLLSFLQQNARDYIPMITIVGFVILDEFSMKLEIPLKHRGNFQDETLKNARSTNFVLFLKEAIVECGITLSPPLRYYRNK